MGNVDAERVVNHEHCESRAVERIRALSRIDVGIALELEGEVDDLLAYGPAAGLATWLLATARHRLRRPDWSPGNQGDVDVATGARAVDRLPLAHGLRANLDCLTFAEDGERLGSPLRGREARSAITTRARDVRRRDRLSPGFGAIRTDSVRRRRRIRRRWCDGGRINQRGLDLFHAGRINPLAGGGIDSTARRRRIHRRRVGPFALGGIGSV